jgi:hypothetical protein
MLLKVSFSTQITDIFNHRMMYILRPLDADVNIELCNREFNILFQIFPILTELSAAWIDIYQCH